MNQPLLHVRIDAGYGKQPTLEHLDFDLHRGDRLGLVGTSGVGKSTLVLALLGLLPWRGGWTKGEVLFEGQNLLSMKPRDTRRFLGKRVAVVPQSPASALNSALSLRAHFDEAWRAHEDSIPDLNQRLQSLLRQVHLPTDPSFLARKPGEVSVGQAQRVLIALALLHRPALLIADEPTSALDPTNQIDILALLRKANRDDGTALLYISHDLLSVIQLCDRMAVLAGGRIVESLSIANIEQHAQHPATLALLETLPVPANLILEYAQRPITRQGYSTVSDPHPAFSSPNRNHTETPSIMWQ